MVDRCSVVEEEGRCDGYREFTVSAREHCAEIDTATEVDLLRADGVVEGWDDCDCEGNLLLCLGENN